MTTEMKQLIRQKISAVIGGDIGEVHPDLFLSETRGDMIVFVFENGCKKMPRRAWYTAWATQGGQAAIIQVLKSSHRGHKKRSGE